MSGVTLQLDCLKGIRPVACLEGRLNRPIASEETLRPALAGR